MIYLSKILERLHSTIFNIGLKIKYGNKIVLGKNNIFRRRVHIRIEKDGKLLIGSGNFFNCDTSITCMNKIVIGNDNIFGENIKFYDHDHKIDILDRKKSFNFGEISIGNNNWIGSSCIILRKTTLKDNNVISCNSVINSKIDSNKLVRVNTSYDISDIKYTKVIK